MQMNNTVLVEFYRSIDSKLLKKLEDFLKSPFFNKDKKVLELHFYLKKIFTKLPCFSNKRKIV